MHRTPALACALALTLLLPTSTTAQSVLPEPGDRAITFGLPSGGGFGFGLRWMRTERRSFGLEVAPSAEWRSTEGVEDDRSRWGLSVRPEFRSFRGDPTDPVVPFVSWGVSIGYTSLDDDRYNFGVGTDVGIGVEWFPLESISIAGSTGIGIDYGRSGGGEAPTIDDLRLAAFRSGLTISLWY